MKVLQRRPGLCFHIVPETEEGPSKTSICGIEYDAAHLGDPNHPDGWYHRQWFGEDLSTMIDAGNICVRCLGVVGAMWKTKQRKHTKNGTRRAPQSHQETRKGAEARRGAPEENAEPTPA